MRALGFFVLISGLLFAPRVEAQGAASAPTSQALSKPSSLPTSLPEPTRPAALDPAAVPAPAPKPATKRRERSFLAEASVGLGLYFEELEVRDPSSALWGLKYQTDAVPSVLVRFGAGWSYETPSHRRLGIVAGLCYRRSLGATIAAAPAQEEAGVSVVHDQVHLRGAFRWQPFVGLPLELDHGLSLAFRRMEKQEPTDAFADHEMVFWGLDPLRASWPLLSRKDSWRVAVEGGLSLSLVGSVGELESTSAPGFGTASGWGYGADAQLTVGYGALMFSLGYCFDSFQLEFDGCGATGSCLSGSEGEQRAHIVWLTAGLVVQR